MKLDKASLITIIVIAIVILGAAYFVWFSDTARERKLDALPTDNFNSIARAINLTDLDDNPVSLSDYRGSVLVVNTWASWCPFCVQELPDFQKLAAEYPEQDVVVLAINRAESKPQIKSYLNTITELNNLIILQDQSDTYYKHIGGFSMPETVFYDTDGNVVVHKRGFMKLDEMRTHVSRAQSESE